MYNQNGSRMVLTVATPDALLKLQQVFNRKGIPNRLKGDTLVAKWNNSSIAVEYSNLYKVYRIMLLSNLSLYDATLSKDKLRLLLYKNFDLIETKVAIDPEGFLILLVDVSEECLTGSDIGVLLDKIEKLKKDLEHVLNLLSE